jgi:dienelactone hydrolase
MTITSEDVRYSCAGTPMHGRLFWNKNARGPRPGVLVFPEGFGISEHTYGKAQYVAELGYVAMACDLYGNGWFHNGPTPEVRANNERVMKVGLLAVGRSAYDVLLARPEVDKGRIAAMGYCIGAPIGLELAFSGALIAAVAGFHPSFNGLTLANAGNVRGLVHFFMGAEDYASTPEARTPLEVAWKGKSVRWQYSIFGGVKHSFTNPNCQGMGDLVAYNAEVDRETHETMAAMFKDAFATPMFDV